MPRAPILRRPDPRHYQIVVLTALLLWGALRLDLGVDPWRVVTILAGTLGTQAFVARLRGERLDLRSPLISGLSLSLLLRTNHAGLALLAAVVTISAKFLLRWRGKHVFNPTNFGLVVMLLLFDGVWVSPGVWGSTATFGFLLAGCGGLVIYRAARSDVTWAFLACWATLVLGRAFWLGDPWTIPLQQLQSGALLIFAFLMISDPKTTPDSRAGRLLFALLVALGGAFVQFGLYRQNGLLWSLAAFALTVPAIDRLLPGPRYAWRRDVRNDRGAIHAGTLHAVPETKGALT